MAWTRRGARRDAEALRVRDRPTDRSKVTLRQVSAQPGTNWKGCIVGHNDTKGEVTIYGLRHWERLVSLSVKAPEDEYHRKVMADSLAALVCEVTPLHRSVLASRYMRGAPGRVATHALPPGLPEGDVQAQERWVALVLLDCVDRAADDLAADHSLPERQTWRAAAEKYTRGSERYGRTCP